MRDTSSRLYAPLLSLSLSLSLLFSLSLSLSLFLPLFPRSVYQSTLSPVQREAKVEANHHAITAPGAAGTPTRSQKAATAFCRPGAFTTAVPVLQNQQSSSSAAEKRALPFPSPWPPLFAKSPEGRPIVRLLASGESIAEDSPRFHLGKAYRGTRKACIKGARARARAEPALSRRHDTLSGMRMVEKKYIWDNSPVRMMDVSF